MPVDIVRDAAIDTMIRIFEKGAYTSEALDRTLKRKAGRLSARGRRFLAQLVYGTVRHKLLADHVLAKIVSQPLADLPAAIRIILRMGVFQSLFCTNVTFPAMVHTSVDLAKKHGHIGTSRLVNAVLNKVPVSLESVRLPDQTESPNEYLSLRFSVPLWLVDQWLETFGPSATRQICEAAASEAPSTARVNLLHTTREKLLDQFRRSKVDAVAHPQVPEAIQFVDGHVPFHTRAFKEGLFYVQDTASILPARLLEPATGELVLDMAAAPGGKSTHLAELTAGTARIVANDIHPRKVHIISENIERLALTGLSLLASDALAPPFQGETFDRVLLDAPCSGLGTLRRRPDIKWRIQPHRTTKLAELQTSLLRSAIALCKNSGVIVYSVCTFAPEETLQVVQSIEGDQTVAAEDGPAWMDPWKIATGTYRVLPEKGGMDGYFLTRLRKRS